MSRKVSTGQPRQALLYWPETSMRLNGRAAKHLSGSPVLRKSYVRDGDLMHLTVEIHTGLR